jgi:hypothetical protein
VAAAIDFQRSFVLGANCTCASSANAALDGSAFVLPPRLGLGEIPGADVQRAQSLT